MNIYRNNNILKEGVQRLVKLVENILEISFLESGIDDLEKEPCSVNFLLRSVFNLHLPLCRKTNLLASWIVIIPNRIY
jgi:signal transduction histidine kinase